MREKLSFLSENCRLRSIPAYSFGSLFLSQLLTIILFACTGRPFSPPSSSFDSIRWKPRSSSLSVTNNRRLAQDNQKLGLSGTHLFLSLSHVFHHGLLHRLDVIGALSMESSRIGDTRRFRRSSISTRFFVCGPERFFGIAQSVLSRCWDTREEKKMQKFEQNCLSEILGHFYFLPGLIRGLRRAKILKPYDVMKLLVGCLNECNAKSFEARIVHSAWNLFVWAPTQYQSGHRHLPQSYNAVLRMFIGGGLIEKAETLLLQMDAEVVPVDWFNLSILMEAYLMIDDIDKSFAVHGRAKRSGWLLSLSCYDSLMDGLVRANQAHVARTVCMDLIEAGAEIETQTLESVIGGLCKDGKVRDAAVILRKMVSFGFALNQSTLENISNSYAEASDLEGLLHFLREFKYAPKDNNLCNRIIYSQSRDLGSEKAISVMQELAKLGFTPDEKSFRIIICSSCMEGRLKRAMKVLSELFLSQLKPDKYIYNAIISSLFKLGLAKHAKTVFSDMIERGVLPDISTFRVLLAGYCKEGRFEDVNWVLQEMGNKGLISPSSLVDSTVAAFSVLGVDSRILKVRRDDTLGLLKTEFYDALGNGLYLDVHVHTFQRALSFFLDDAVNPDLELSILRECSKGDMETSLKLKDEMIHWGQQPSPSVYSVLLKWFSAHGNSKATAGLLNEMPKQHLQQMDHDTLSLAMVALIDQGKASDALMILEEIIARNLPAENRTCAELMVGLCQEETRREFLKSWQLASQNGWIPSLADARSILHCFLLLNMLGEMLQFLEKMLMNYLESTAFICGLFFEELSHHPGLAKVGLVLFQELLKRSLSIDVVIYENIIRALCLEKMILEAIQVFDDMLEKAHVPSFDVYTLIVPILFKLGYSRKAINLGFMLLNKQVVPASTVYTSLINELSRMGNISNASLFLQKAMANGVRTEMFAFDAVLSGKCLEKNCNHVYEILCSMLKRGMFPSLESYRNMLKLFCFEGNIFDALRLKDIFLGERKYSNIAVYALLIYQLFEAGSVPSVQNLLLEMHEKGIVIDSVVYNILVAGFSTCRDVSNSLKFLKVMIKKNIRPSKRCFGVVLSSLCDSLQVDKALELLCEGERRGWTPYNLAYHKLVTALLRVDMVKKAEDFLNQMQDNSSFFQCGSYDVLIRECCRYQMLGRAVDFLNMMLKKRNLPAASSYRALVHGFCGHNSFDVALDLYTEMLHQGLEPGVVLSAAIVRGLCKEGRVSDARDILSGMLERGQNPPGSMFQDVVGGFFNSNEFKKASEVLHLMQQAGHRPNFSTHWSLVHNLASLDGKKNASKGLLSRVLAEGGFPFKETTR